MAGHGGRLYDRILAGLAASAGRMGQAADLADTAERFAPRWAIAVELTLDTAPAAGSVIEIYWAASRDNLIFPGGVTGNDGAYRPGRRGPSEEAASFGRMPGLNRGRRSDRADATFRILAAGSLRRAGDHQQVEPAARQQRGGAPHHLAAAGGRVRRINLFVLVFLCSLCFFLFHFLNRRKRREQRVCSFPGCVVMIASRYRTQPIAAMNAAGSIARIHRASPQAQGLVAWWPLGPCTGNAVPDGCGAGHAMAMDLPWQVDPDLRFRATLRRNPRSVLL